MEVTSECIGCGACTQCDNFEVVDEDEKRIAKPKQALVDSLECNQDAADTCPVSAIKITKL
ncbi:ferredoxin [Candidatus Woesearchaeota archaeon]|nr:ferredoxin [Candidatus Woesearchaeota archaeon]